MTNPPLGVAHKRWSLGWWFCTPQGNKPGSQLVLWGSGYSAVLAKYSLRLVDVCCTPFEDTEPQIFHAYVTTRPLLIRKHTTHTAVRAQGGGRLADQGQWYAPSDLACTHGVTTHIPHTHRASGPLYRHIAILLLLRAFRVALSCSPRQASAGVESVRVPPRRRALSSLSLRRAMAHSNAPLWLGWVRRRSIKRAVQWRVCSRHIVADCVVCAVFAEHLPPSHVDPRVRLTWRQPKT
jgi:hypothetical protein